MANENKNSAEVKTAKAPVKAPKKRKSLKRRFKEIFSELKKVSWPSFSKVMQNTGIVLVVVLFFLVLLGLFDGGISTIMKQIVG